MGPTNQLPVSMETIPADSVCIRTISHMTEHVFGHGSFGIVFQAKRLESGEAIAIKKVLQHKHYKNCELQTMRLLDHPVPETTYRVTRHYSNANQRMLMIYVKLYTYQLTAEIVGEVKELADLHHKKAEMARHSDNDGAYASAESRDGYQPFKVLSHISSDFHSHLPAAYLSQHYPVPGIVYSALKVSVALGYMTPEYITTEKFTVKSYGYAFGIVIVQILLGKSNLTRSI